MAKRGQPTKYRKEYCDQAYKYCLLGAIDEQLAEFFGVCTQTLYKWKNAHPEFRDALREGKERADAEVADKLFQRAKGYEHPEEKIFCHQGEIVRAGTTKHYPPDTGAAVFWLKNRAGWKDRVDVEGGAEIRLSDESLEALDEATKNVAELLNACRT